MDCPVSVFPFISNLENKQEGHSDLAEFVFSFLYNYLVAFVCFLVNSVEVR